MRALKAAGVIKKIPGGRRAKPEGRTLIKAADVKVIERAQAIIANDQPELATLPAAPWEDQSHSEKLSTLTGKALDKTRQILDLPCDPANLKLLSIQKDAALSILSTQTKVDENRLRQPRNNDRLAVILERLKQHDEEEARRGNGWPDPNP